MLEEGRRLGVHGWLSFGGEGLPLWVVHECPPSIPWGDGLLGAPLSPHPGPASAPGSVSGDQMGYLIWSWVWSFLSHTLCRAAFSSLWAVPGGVDSKVTNCFLGPLGDLHCHVLRLRGKEQWPLIRNRLGCGRAGCSRCGGSRDTEQRLSSKEAQPERTDNCWISPH